MAAYSIVPPTARERYRGIARPVFEQFVPHTYWLGGFDIVRNIGIDLDELGREWVRTFNLRCRRTGIEYRMIDPEDLPTLLGRDFVSEEKVIEMYGRTVGYEVVPAEMKRRWARHA